MSKRDIVVALAGASVAALVAGGVAWAAIPGPDGVIQGCYDSGGNVKVVAALPCPKGFTSLPWNQRGPQGGPGAAGVSPSVTPLAAGDANCPAGGAAITDAAGSTAYVCSGKNGADGQPFSGTFTSPNGQYSISVDDAGIKLERTGGSSIELAGNDIVVSSAGAYSTVAGTDLSLTSGSGFDLTSGGAFDLTGGGSMTATIAGNALASIGGDASTQVNGNLRIHVVKDTAVQIDKDATLQMSGPLLIKSSQGVSLRGSTVEVNGSSTCPQAARVGDLVDLTTGEILDGSATVCIG
jgi:hypothetical protein